MGFLLLLLHVSLSLSNEKYNVCSLTINSDDEINAFKKHLNPKDFHFIELTDVIDPQAKAKKEVPNDWFDAVCEKDIRCDVLLISGHFGGSFFGDSGISLPLDNLEQASCTHKCQNILNAATEVFLFGCNTLATKQQDHRSPEQYLQVLVDDGIDRTQAERIVQARYGALGSSFKDRMQRVFENVPNIYGFDSVGPSGKTVKPFLDKYFSKIGDYKEHLLKLQTKGIVDTLSKLNTSNAKLHNPILADTLSSTAYAECAGITASDPAYKFKKEICKFYDENLSTDNKVALAEALLSTDDALLYIPTISSYFSKKNANSSLSALRANKKIEKLLNDLIKDLEGSPGIYVDMLHLQLQIGYITAADYSKKIKKLLTPYAKKMDRSSVDVLCSIFENGERDILKQITFSANDINISKLSTVDGMEALNCITIEEDSKETISKALVAIKGQQKQEEHQMMYLWTLMEKTTTSDLKSLIPYLLQEFNKIKNSEYKMGIQIGLVNSYRKLEDMKGLEDLYKTGNLSAYSGYDSRQSMVEAAAAMATPSTFYGEKALTIIKENMSTEDYYKVGSVLGAVKSQAQVNELLDVFKNKKVNEVMRLFNMDVDEDMNNGVPIVHPRIMDFYVDTLIKEKDESFDLSTDVIPSLNASHKNRLLKFATENPNTYLATSIQEKIKADSIFTEKN